MLFKKKKTVEVVKELKYEKETDSDRFYLVHNIIQAFELNFKLFTNNTITRQTRVYKVLTKRLSNTVPSEFFLNLKLWDTPLKFTALLYKYSDSNLEKILKVLTKHKYYDNYNSLLDINRNSKIEDIYKVMTKTYVDFEKEKHIPLKFLELEDYIQDELDDYKTYELFTIALAYREKEDIYSALERLSDVNIDTYHKCFEKLIEKEK